MTDDTYKLPRLFTNQRLSNGGGIALTDAQAHYLHTVMRRKDRDEVRLFNAADGEWLASLNGLKKKSGTAELVRQLKEQPDEPARIHLYFAPITKNRMDWLVEKAVELGITDMHPVLTQNTEVRKIKEERLTAQMMEAAEQSERLSIPLLHSLVPLNAALAGWDADNPFLACLERYDATPMAAIKSENKETAILIGPVGGFTEEEKNTIASMDFITPVSLGDNVLRCETAAIYALSVLQAKRAVNSG